MELEYELQCLTFCSFWTYGSWEHAAIMSPMNGKVVHLLVEPVIHQRFDADLGVFWWCLFDQAWNLYYQSHWCGTVCTEWPKKQMAFNKKLLKCQQCQHANSLSFPHHHFFSDLFSFLRAVQMSLHIYEVYICSRSARAAIGWNIKWIIQLISTLWLFFQSSVTRAPCC